MEQKYDLVVNGLNIEAVFDTEDVQEVFLPLLSSLVELQKKKNRRIFIFLAAPPGTGKTTLTLFLEYLAEKQGYQNLQCAGMDGFHYYNDYLLSHEADVDGEKVCLKDIKGSKYTFDTDKLYEKLKEASCMDSLWPVYSRETHEPKEDMLKIDKDIVLFEGNYLLLEEEKWARLREFCDLSILIYCDAALLKERLIHRKEMGGSSRKEAEEWYKQSDYQNIVTVLNESVEPDILIQYEGNRYRKVVK